MAFELPKLPYSYDALEPYIDAKTMEIHHTKHHQAYVDNLNKALTEQPELLKMDVEALLTDTQKVADGVRQTVINNAGGHANHTFFWKVMAPHSKQVSPSGAFLTALENTFGSLDKFEEVFTAKALSVFGSGWAFLIMKKDKSLALKRHSFQNSPIMQGNNPILGVDVWEHAYYLKYQNRRADYLSSWWKVVNWRQVEENFRKANKEA